MKLIMNKGSSSIMFIDGGEHKMLLPDSRMEIEDEAAEKLLKFYGFVEDLTPVVEEKPKEVVKKKSKRSKKKKLQAFED